MNASDLFSSAESEAADIVSGVTDAYSGSQTLTKGVVTAGVQFGSDFSSSLSNFFGNISDTLDNNPNIVTYIVYGLGAYSAYRAYRFLSGK